MRPLDEIAGALWKNKVEKGFNTTDVPLEFCLLIAEVGEAFDAWRKGGDVAPELADVLLFTLSLAHMLDVDLVTAADEKMRVNVARTYVTGPQGLKIKE